MNAKSLEVKILLAFAAVYFAWGSTYIAIRFAVETIPPFFMGGVRFLIAGGLLYLYARLRGAAVPQLRQWIPAGIVGALLLLCGNGAVVLAEKTVPSGMVSLLIAMVPIYFALVEWIRPGGKAPGLRTSIGLLIGTIGLLLLIGLDKITSAGAEPLDPRGVVIVMLGSLAWTVGSLYSRSVRIAESPSMAIAMQTLSGGVLMLLASIGLNETATVDLSAITMKSLVSVLYLIVFGSLIGFSAYVWLLKTVRPALVATYAYVNPVVAVFLGWLLGGEVLNTQSMIAGAVILSAVWLITGSQEKPSEPKPAEAEEDTNKTNIEKEPEKASA